MESRPPSACLAARPILSVLALLCLLFAIAIPRIHAASPADPTRIGVILPLSGKFARAGLEVKRGIDLAYEQLPPTSAGPLTIYFRDTGDDPLQTARAVRELVAEERVVAIIGPLVSSTVDAAALAATELQVPMIALTQKSDVPGLGGYVFRNFLTSEMQMRSLVGYAMDVLGLKRFAVVYPEQRYGMELTGLFWDEVTSRGGQITGAESYEVGTTDFLNVARRVGGKFYDGVRKQEFIKGQREYKKAYEQAGKKPGKPYELPPVVDYDALFIPDNYKTASLIAATLAYTEIPVGKFTITKDQPAVRLLGSSAWNNPDLGMQGGDYVEGAIFVDQFFAQSPDPRVQSFVSSFQRVHQRAPDLLAAVGYDALGLLHSQVRERPTDRPGLRAKVAQMTGYRGITGTLAFDDRGEPRTPPYVLSVKRKSLIQLAPTLEEPGGARDGKASSPQKQGSAPAVGNRP